MARPNQAEQVAHGRAAVGMLEVSPLPPSKGGVNTNPKIPSWVKSLSMTGGKGTLHPNDFHPC